MNEIGKAIDVAKRAEQLGIVGFLVLVCGLQCFVMYRLWMYFTTNLANKDRVIEEFSKTLDKLSKTIAEEEKVLLESVQETRREVVTKLDKVDDLGIELQRFVNTIKTQIAEMTKSASSTDNSWQKADDEGAAAKPTAPVKTKRPRRQS